MHSELRRLQSFDVLLQEAATSESEPIPVAVLNFVRARLSAAVAKGKVLSAASTNRSSNKQLNPTTPIPFSFALYNQAEQELDHIRKVSARLAAAGFYLQKGALRRCWSSRSMPITAMTHSIAELKTLMHSPSNMHDNVPLAHGLAAQSVPLDTGGSVDHISSCDDAATPFVATASLKGAVTVWESHNATPLSKVLAFDTTKPDTFAVASGVTDAASLVGARVVAAAVLPSFTSSAKRAEAAKAIAEARAERTPQATKAEPQLPDSYYEIMLTMQTVQAHGRASDDDVWSSWAVRDIEVKVKGSSPFVGAEVRWRPVV